MIDTEQILRIINQYRKNYNHELDFFSKTKKNSHLWLFLPLIGGLSMIPSTRNRYTALKSPSTLEKTHKKSKYIPKIKVLKKVNTFSRERNSIYASIRVALSRFLATEVIPGCGNGSIYLSEREKMKQINFCKEWC